MNTKLGLGICAVCFLCWNGILVAGESYNLTQLTTDDGLTSNTIRHIHQDKTGYLWFCTTDGLNRYDGTSLTGYYPNDNGKPGLNDARTRNISEDGSGNLWINSIFNNFSCYNVRKGCFEDVTDRGRVPTDFSSSIHFGDTTWLYGGRTGAVCYISSPEGFTASTVSKWNQTLSSLYIRYFANSSEGTWVGTEKGLFLLTENGSQCIVNQEDFVAQLSLPDRELFLTADGRVRMMDRTEKEKNVTRFVGRPQKIGDYLYAFRYGDLWLIYGYGGCRALHLPTLNFIDVPDEFHISHARRSLTDNQGGVWIADDRYQLFYFNEKWNVRKCFHLLPSEMRMQSYEFFSVFHGKRGNVWITTAGNGLFSYNIHRDKLEHFTTSSQSGIRLPDNFLKYVYEDRCGSLWLGTSVSGIVHIRFAESENGHYVFQDRENQGPKNHIRFIKPLSDGSILFGNRNGNIFTAAFQDGTLTDIQSAGQHNHLVYCATETNDNKLVLGTRGGGVIIDGEHFSHSPQQDYSLSSDEVFDMLCDRKGRLWITTFGGGVNVALPDGNGKYRFRHFFNNRNDRYTRAICMDKNGWIWIASTNGVFIFEPDHLLSDPERFVRLSTDTPQKLHTNEIRSLHCDRTGRIWIAETGFGIACCLPDGNYQELDIKHFNHLDGVLFPTVESFEDDMNGNLWLSTENGILCLYPETGHASRHLYAFGTMANAFCENSSCCLDNRYVLFGSHDGILLIDSDLEDKKEMDAPMILSQVRRDGQLIDKENISIRAGYSAFDLSFAIFDYASPTPPLYSYFLEGRDTQWSIPMQQHTLSLNGLRPGRYTIHARGYFGSSSCREIAVPFRVEPPLWLQWWAILLYLLVLARIGMLIHRHYLSHRTLLEHASIMEKENRRLQKQFADDILTSSGVGSSDMRMMEKIDAIISDELANPGFTADSLAQQLNLSHTTFYQTFTRLAGCTPKDYMRQKRMKEAARLLLTSDNNVSQIAFATGFSDLSYFSKCFKQYFGTSPLRYKNEHTGRERS